MNGINPLSKDRGIDMVSESPHSPDAVTSPGESNGLDDRDLLEKILPPGPRTLFVNWYYIIGPPSIASLLVCSLGRFTDLPIPFWVTVLVCLLSYPILHLAFSAWTDFRAQRRAAALCANIPILAKKSMVNGPVVYEEAYPREHYAYNLAGIISAESILRSRGLDLQASRQVRPVIYDAPV